MAAKKKAKPAKKLGKKALKQTKGGLIPAVQGIHKIDSGALKYKDQLKLGSLDSGFKIRR